MNSDECTYIESGLLGDQGNHSSAVAASGGSRRGGQDTPRRDGSWDDRRTYYQLHSSLWSSHPCNNNNNNHANKSYTWQELQAIEFRRRSILRRTELSFWKILSFWDGTCLQTLSRDSLLWATILIYVAIRFQARYDGNLPTFVARLSTAKIDVIGGFLSFFLVIFVNQSNARVSDMYKQSMDCQQRICDIASLAATGIPQRAMARRLVRYLNAAHVAGYVGLSYSRTYTKENVFDELTSQSPTTHSDRNGTCSRVAHERRG